jgi:hypothetical protein
MGFVSTLGVVPELSEIVERVGSFEFAGVNQVHEQIARCRIAFFKALSNQIIVQRRARFA